MTIFFSFKDKSSIYEAGILVDVGFTTVETNRNQKDQLDNKKKQVIESVLNEEFCSLDIESLSQGETCKIQNLKYRVKKVLVVELYLLLSNQYYVHLNRFKKNF